MTVPAVVNEPEQTDDDKFCKICNISVTSKHQMKLHLEGTKHAKKLKASATTTTTTGKDS